MLSRWQAFEPRRTRMRNGARTVVDDQALGGIISNETLTIFGWKIFARASRLFLVVDVVSGCFWLFQVQWVWVFFSAE